jgi:aspartate/methionine/tyrosine aminotransferase
MEPTTALGRAVAERARAWLEPLENEALIEMGGGMIAGTTPQRVRAGVSDAVQRHLTDHYTRRPGIAPLGRVVADQLNAAGVAVDADKDVVIAGGVQESRFVALRSLAAGRTVYLPLPALVDDYAVPARFAGSEVVTFELTDELPAAPNGLLVLVDPNPVTGQALDEANAARLARWVIEQDMLVVADASAAALLRAEVAYRLFASRDGMAERTLTIGSFADIPGLASWNVAWFGGARKLTAKARDLKQAMTICSPAASQYAALSGIDGPADLAAQNQERVEALVGLLARFGLPYRDPQTYAFVVADVARLGGGAKVAAACARHGVRIRDGATFGRPNWVRLTATGDRFADGLAGIEAALTELNSEVAR